jgi:hypothetical protein
VGAWEIPSMHFTHIVFNMASMLTRCTGDESVECPCIHVNLIHSRSFLCNLWKHEGGKVIRFQVPYLGESQGSATEEVNVVSLTRKKLPEDVQAIFRRNLLNIW